MPSANIRVDSLMESCGVKFGTSGARGLASAMTDEVCYAFTLAFLQHLEKNNELIPGSEVAVGGDLRPSTDRIMSAVAKAVIDKGYGIINCGKLPSPALAYSGLINKIPGIMVTGSHIPCDRNGIKYNKSTGEILKADEASIKEQRIDIPLNTFDKKGALASKFSLKPSSSLALDSYIKRYTDFFPVNCLKGKKIGLYEHSSVGREAIHTILISLGAHVTRLGFSDEFIPVDTEAIRPEDVKFAKQWANENSFDAIVSSDGDSDRPMISDENGNWLRGDIAGILCSSFLGADAVVTPVSSNTAVEKSGLFSKVIRTKIGSPFVIEGMIRASASGSFPVVGYEANGGFLTNSPIELNGKTLATLPTRDAVIVIISILMQSIQHNKPISQLKSDLPKRFTASGMLKEFPAEKSRDILNRLSSGDFHKDKSAIELKFSKVSGKVSSIDTTDGLRVTFQNSEIIHLRASGNAPEFRCYTEAVSEERSIEMNKTVLKIMETWEPLLSKNEIDALRPQ